jgi:hypothetical protein
MRVHQPEGEEGLLARPVDKTQNVVVDRAFYMLPAKFIGVTLRARRDKQTVRFSARGVVVNVLPTVARGQCSFDEADIPSRQRAYAPSEPVSILRCTWSAGTQRRRSPTTAMFGTTSYPFVSSMSTPTSPSSDPWHRQDLPGPRS